MAPSRLFKPIQLGKLELQQRIAMAPLTRFRASDDHVILPIAEEYYAQRASVPGTFLITEATIVAKRQGGYANVPGIYNQDQIDAWKKVTKAVHDKGSYIYLQLWALGRVADPDFAQKSGIDIISSSAVPVDDQHAVPKEMTQDDIDGAISDFAQAAKNAIEAGFDGVEIHGANGYLVDQFFQDTSNKRTDNYGGSVENRSRFGIEIAKAVVNAVGADRTGIRLSPFSDFQGMHMKEPYQQFHDIVRKLNELKLAYIHLVESRISGNADIESTDSIAPFLKEYKAGPVLVAGGFKADSAFRLVDEEFQEFNVLVVFGRYFISNPDLVYRLQKGIEFTPYDRSTFYKTKSPEGYIDYPFSKEFEAAQA